MEQHPKLKGMQDKLNILWKENELGQTESPSRPFTSEVIRGQAFVHENLNGMTFRISPLAFFQVNTGATEKMYSLIKEYAKVDNSTTVLDLCCGTGTIGLSMASSAERVIGIELSEQAVQDAKFNALLNNQMNTEFIDGDCKQKLNAVLLRRSMAEDKLVAVLDPPRQGLPKSVLEAIRKCEQIKRLVFVSCDPRGLITNLPILCKRAGQGKPFLPITSRAIDMFPHTLHQEVVVVLKR